MIEGLELIARSEAAIEGTEDNSVPNGDSDTSVGFVKRISKGALKMLKKHIDTLSLSLEE